MTRAQTLAPVSLSRRAALAGGASLTLAFVLGGPPGAGEAQASGAAAINAYVRIDPDGTITIMNPTAEMGQGVVTAVPLVIAEELDADWANVRVRQAPVDRAYDHGIFKSQFAVGSLTMRGYWMPARIAGAQARRVLLEAAAHRWGVPLAELSTEPSLIVHAASDRRMGYGEAAALSTPPGALPAIKPEELKPVARFRLIGRDVTPVDIADKTVGKARYAIDVRVPGMLYATLAQPPVPGATVRSSNLEYLRSEPDINHALVFEEGIGIIGRSMEAVFAARQKLRVAWTNATGSDSDSEADLQNYLAHVRDPGRKGVVARATGDAAAALGGAARVISGEFTTDYVYHAQMEPMNCTASVTPDGVEVWAGTQWLTDAVAQAAKAAGVPAEKVTLHPMPMGGGFGRGAFLDYVTQAVLLSKAAGAPVKMVLSREDDLATGRFRPLTAQKIDVGLDADGKVVGWRHRLAADLVVPTIYSPARLEAQKGIDHIVVYGADVPFYDVPAHVAEHVYEERGVRVGAWRGVGAGYTNFAIEAMVDEIANAVGQDPCAFRLSFLKDARARRVVERAASMADWGRKREGRALGIAFTKLGLPPVGYSVAGTVAEVSVDRSSGALRVHSVWAAVDVGLPIQPTNLVAQMEGSIVWALGAALKERVTIKDGTAEQSNFHDYEVPRMSDIPEITVELIPSGETPLLAGELTIGGVAPAIAGAFQALTGRSLRQIPFTSDRVKAALA